MDQSLLLVHAHPDDESINNGATMAKYAARGTRVTLVTCTLGEEGEVLVPELAHLASDKDDALGSHRVTELAHAMMELGVTDHRFLGGQGRYRDSGMVWHEDGHAVAGEDVKRGHVLEGRPDRGGGPSRRGDPRGPAAGDGHLRRVRQLRAPRPHPGAPGRDVRRAAGGRPVVPPRPGRAVGRREDLLGRACPRAACARGCAGCGRRATRPRSRGWTPTVTCRRSSPRTTLLVRGRRRQRLRRRQDRAR